MALHYFIIAKVVPPYWSIVGLLTRPKAILYALHRGCIRLFLPEWQFVWPLGILAISASNNMVASKLASWGLQLGDGERIPRP
jgi:hypothetical protein